MQCGYDCGQKRTLCIARSYPDLNAHAGILLFGYGTEPHRNAACPDALAQVVQANAKIVADQFDMHMNKSSYQDLRYLAIRIMEALQRANTHTREVSRFVGQGIYNGGVISCIIENQFFIFPFGGGVAYTWDGKKLTAQGSSNINTPVIRDALGVMPQWQGTAWQGSVPENGILLTASEAPKELDKWEEFVRNRTELDHPNTLAMQLRQHMIQNTERNAAVLEFWNRPQKN